LANQFGGVHGNKAGAATMQWRNKPLFRRTGDVKFKTGTEAAELLVAEAKRHDPHELTFIQTFSEQMVALAPAIDRNPKYAWIAKQLIEPERQVSFRVAWLDDSGTVRLNRGTRVQYSSSLGPYEGGLHFGTHVTTDYLKAAALDAVSINALANNGLGGAAGGSDFDPSNKSEAEIQRFCQNFMTELAKYIGPDVDLPSMGYMVGPHEVGYLYGQYKRIHQHGAAKGTGLMWGGLPPWPHAAGFGVAHFAERLLRDKRDSLAGKRVLITGAGQVALAVAERVIAFGGVPLTFSDWSGHVYEEDGIDAVKLNTIKKIKADRGARVGRYVVASTTAKYSEPHNIFAIPCDLCIPCSGTVNEIGEAEANLLADHGCTVVVEGANMPTSPAAHKVFKKRGVSFAPYKATLAVGTVASGAALAHTPLATADALDAALASRADEVFKLCKETAKEFNSRGDLAAGAQIAAFVRVAEVMERHGAV